MLRFMRVRGGNVELWGERFETNTIERKDIRLRKKYMEYADHFRILFPEMGTTEKVILAPS